MSDHVKCKRCGVNPPAEKAAGKSGMRPTLCPGCQAFGRRKVGRRVGRPPADRALVARVCGRLRAAAKARGLNGLDLAHRAGLGAATVYFAFDGRHTPGLALVSRLARVLDLSLDALVAPEEAAGAA